jgi:spectinomycin phosphotransferase
MLEPPNLPVEKILLCLSTEFGISSPRIEFLPLGADLNTAVYRVDIQSDKHYFLKLRSGEFSEPSVVLPAFFYDQGVHEIIPPIPILSGNYWTILDDFHAILYPYIEGQDGYEVDLSDDQLRVFGKVIKKIHQMEVPQHIQKKIPIETFSSMWSDQLLKYTQLLDGAKYSDLISQNLADLLITHKDTISHLMFRVELLSKVLKNRPSNFVICHSDLHAGNLLIDKKKNLYIVDWDTLLMAPKERDLMYIGGGQGFRGHTLEEEVELFYQGYGETSIDHEALAFYRYARIIEDMAVECAIIFSTDHSNEDRKRELGFFKANFVPGGVIEIAQQLD